MWNHTSSWPLTKWREVPPGGILYWSFAVRSEVAWELRSWLGSSLKRGPPKPERERVRERPTPSVGVAPHSVLARNKDSSIDLLLVPMSTCAALLTSIQQEKFGTVVVGCQLVIWSFCVDVSWCIANNHGGSPVSLILILVLSLPRSLVTRVLSRLFATP